ncbi:MAG: SEL1-like repeat protein [Cyanobacteria bacterium TGS_CYA1]|nr:SEL1-like repeat protein [Cyanobacteria bacterium TGS_CYA1]
MLIPFRRKRFLLSLFLVATFASICSTDIGLAKKSEGKEQTKDRPIADKWAVIIGIDKFQDKGIPELEYSAKDAKDFADFLVEKGHFARDHVILMVNEQATEDNILDAVGDNGLPRRVQKDDLVVIYASTHGSPREMDIRGENYLVAYDTKLSRLFSSSIKLKDLLGTIKYRTGCERIVLLLDACNSGVAADLSDGQKGGKALLRVNTFNAEELAGKGQVVITSSSANERSWESKRYKNGVFTHNLIDALQQAGDGTNLADAFEDLKEKVLTEVQFDRKSTQTPVMNNQWSGESLALLKAPARPRNYPRYVPGLGSLAESLEPYYAIRVKVEFSDDLFNRATAGDIQSQYEMGRVLFSGAGIDKSIAMAQKWFQRAADQGHPGAQFFLGSILLDKKVTAKPDPQAGFDWLLKAANAGEPMAEARVSQIYKDGIITKADPKECFDWAKKSADQNCAYGKMALAGCYLNSIGTAFNPGEAIKLFKETGKDVPEAYGILGLLYSNGVFVEKSPEEGFKFYKMAADGGDLDSQYQLGLCYLSGAGTAKDLNLAFKSFEAASKSGSAKHISQFAKCYESGTGIKPDTVKAVSLYKTASELGDEEAKNALKRLSAG